MSEEKCFIQCLMLWAIFIPNVSLYMVKYYLLGDTATATEDYVQHHLKPSSHRRDVSGLDTIQLWSYLSRWLKLKTLKSSQQTRSKKAFSLCAQATKPMNSSDQTNTQPAPCFLCYGNQLIAQCLWLFVVFLFCFFKSSPSEFLRLCYLFSFCLKTSLREKIMHQTKITILLISESLQGLYKPPAAGKAAQAEQ